MGVDLGTTHCKVGLFELDGSAVRLASRRTATYRTVEGYVYHDPEELWSTAASTMTEVLAGLPPRYVDAVGVASMAEAGLLVDRKTGAPRSHVLPWYDARAERQAEEIAREEDPLRLFRRSGLRPSFKYGLPKLLWLRAQDPEVTQGAVWLSVADYVVYRLTGRFVTDPTLAARTYLFHIGDGRWDDTWIRHVGLTPELFPEVLPSGTPAGTVHAEGAARTGLSPHTPVAVAGHDHICALLAAGIVEPDVTLDSMGTAESLLGVLGGASAGRPGEREFESGLAVVPHVVPGQFCWLGGSPSSGGAIEWLRSQLAEEPLPYQQMMELLREADGPPTGILFYPYLSGSGAPCPDADVRAAFIGLSASHRRGDLVKGVLEGTAYAVESIRRAAERLVGRQMEEVIAVGGGAKNRLWVQIKADISGRRHRLPPVIEATAQGAALAAGAGGARSSFTEVARLASGRRGEGETIVPNAERHAMYRTLYDSGYRAFEEPLRRHARSLPGRRNASPQNEG